MAEEISMNEEDIGADAGTSSGRVQVSAEDSGEQPSSRDGVEVSDDDKAGEPPRGCCYRCCTRIGCGCCCTLPQRWPRTFGILLGIVVPLFMLIAVSLLFGYFLAKLEAPGEVDTNNAIVATKQAIVLRQELVGNVTKQLPTICSSVYLIEQALDLPYQECIENNQINNTATNTSNTNSTQCTKPPSLESVAIEDTIQQVINNQFPPCVGINENRTWPILHNTEGIDLPNKIKLETEELLIFMGECGQTALEVAEEYKLEGIIDVDLVSSEVSFNWIRCDDSSDDFKDVDGFVNDLFNPFTNTTDLLPSVQAQSVFEAWRADQQGLYCEFLAEALLQNKTLAVARFEALERSFAAADGHGNCKVNYWAGAWFWFTVMTTIGYGNTAPATVGARAMVFTLGFFSILMFAGILAKAGSIVTAIVDDFVDRVKLSVVNRPSLSALFWGALYYAWMILIASYYQWWEMERLENPIEYADAYWFAYISTTTVGLGDYYLEHGVIISQDLLVWPLLFLFGFVLLSSFLTKVSEFLFALVPSHRPSFEESLAEADVPLCPKLLKRNHTVHGTSMRNDEDILQDANESPGSSREASDASAAGLGVSSNSKVEDDSAAAPQDEFVSVSTSHATPVIANKSIEAGDGWKGVIHNIHPDTALTEP